MHVPKTCRFVLILTETNGKSGRLRTQPFDDDACPGTASRGPSLLLRVNCSGIQNSGVRIQNTPRIRLQQLASLCQQLARFTNITVFEIPGKNQIVSAFLQ